MSNLSTTPSTNSTPRALRRDAKSYAATVARRMRTLMRDQDVSTSTLQWILGSSWARAFRLRHGSMRWTCTEVFRVVDACTPAGATASVVPYFAPAAA